MPRRRKLLFRSWHRGMREMDLILGGFADADIAALTDAELDQYESAARIAGRRSSALVHRRTAHSGQPTTRHCCTKIMAVTRRDDDLKM